MPARSNAKQATVFYVRQHYADEHSTVTESKMLTDAVTGDQKEVDVVVETQADGEDVMLSFEVQARKRKMGRPEVDALIKKHDRLPTHRLFLVSFSGFTEPALRAVAAEGGRITAVKPTLVESAGAPVVQTLYIDQIQMSATSVQVRVLTADGQSVVARVEPTVDLYDDQGRNVGMMAHLVRSILDQAMGTAARTAHDDPQRDTLRSFEVAGEIDQALNLRHADSGELHRVDRVTIRGHFTFEQSELPLSAGELAGRRYLSGETQFFGRPSIWVATPGPDETHARISYRALDVGN